MTQQDTFENIGWVWILIAIITFCSLFFGKVTAPFGRHTRSDWGPMIANSWGWFWMEIISPIGLWIGFYIANDGVFTVSIQALIGMIAWTVHYINRTFIFPFRMPNKKKKMPVIIMGSAIFFNSINGTLNGYFLGHDWVFQSDYLMYFGILLFSIGMFINIKSDNILLGLRKPGETHYVVPNKYLFKKICSPNLFGEIIEWVGFLCIAPSVASLSFLIWTLANLMPRARDHYNWYIKTFRDYPKDRYVLFPFIW
ncbi:hypothetical protein EI427_03145 [Flammeovirga pectinis]|uniref:3-oxo-5-alpha-steroid 4-dehydrogenase C-terminal domain-containing protein n=1 Tax=Flammeovirga pectinis TaxID=2494373 RepID=A0A3S9NZ33_9BACT|nr:hypothetical protein [Flammeovirga pectinis]AZQ61250.1 hypothetical protein EI427_03145 [Flammeovirga pectinis]